jgi:DNA-binding LytR/AlgR family response regulator
MYLDYKQIILCEARGKQTWIYTVEQPLGIRFESALAEIEKLLPAPLFFRCHRSRIINLGYLSEFTRYDRTIQLIKDVKAVISEDRIPEFLRRTNPAIRQLDDSTMR